MSDELGARRLVGRVFEAAADEPDAGFELRMFRAVEAGDAGARRAGHSTAGRRLPRGLRSRSALLLVAACTALAVGTTTALAGAGLFGRTASEVTSSMGLRAAITGGQRVDA